MADDFVARALAARGLAWRVEGAEVGPGGETRVALVSDGASLTVRIAPRSSTERAFRRTASFDVSYEGSIDRSSTLHGAIVAIVDAIAAADGGGISWSRARRSLPVVRSGAALALRQPEWSRELFDRNIVDVPVDAGAHGVVIVVHQSCLMHCLFCPEPDLALPGQETYEPSEVERHQADLVHQLAWGRRVGATMVEFGGNDVLRYPEAIALFDETRRLGYTRVIAQSPGQSLADLDFARRVAASGVTELHIPIYGDTPERHDAVVGVPGAFDDAVRGIDNVLSLGAQEVLVHTIALRSRIAWLEDVLSFVQARFGLVARVTPLRPNRDDDRHHFAEITPIGELRALASSRWRQFVEQPLCGLTREAAELRYEASKATAATARPFSFYDVGRRPGMENESARRRRTRANPPACQACARREQCPGVLGSYLEQCGDADLVPFEQ